MAKELYVGSLSYEVTEYDLEKLFSVSGRVTSIHLITDPKTGQFKGCGYVRMSSEAEAKDAIQSLDGALLIDRKITVSMANPQKQKTQGGGYKGKPAGPKPGGASGAKPLGTKPSGAKASGAKASTAKPAGAKTSGANPAGAKPASARPSGAKPSAAKPSGGKAFGESPSARSGASRQGFKPGSAKSAPRKSGK